MSETFVQLGIPFPLFEAPTDQASGYPGPGTCSLCGHGPQHRFRLGIGDYIVVDCPTCGTANGLDADDWESVLCRQCNAGVPFPVIKDEEITICYACLREGRAAIVKDTELGMISWHEAVRGVTHGVPGLNRSDFEMVPAGDDWTAARLPQEMMFELLRTPTYLTIQGEEWQFCCQQAMVFLGGWSREEFSRRAPDGDGRSFFEKVVQDSIPGLWEDELHDETGVYVFRCPTCGRLKAHWDLA